MYIYMYVYICICDLFLKTYIFCRKDWADWGSLKALRDKHTVGFSQDLSTILNIEHRPWPPFECRNVNQLQTVTESRRLTKNWLHWLTFYFMVVGTQDKGHKVSNVQVMPLLLGALPLEEVRAVRH